MPDMPENKNPDSGNEIEKLLQAANQGDAGAQCALGFMYAYGRGVARDDKKAVEWYSQAAKQGHAAAQYNLGFMYAKGRGVKRDDKKAVTWFRQAAVRGHADAQNNLGSRYANGRGVPKDDVQAVELLSQAAEQGYAQAQNNLGVMYAEGRGVVAANLLIAAYYRSLAKAGGYNGAGLNETYYAQALKELSPATFTLDSTTATNIKDNIAALKAVIGDGKSINDTLQSIKDPNNPEANLLTDLKKAIKARSDKNPKTVEAWNQALGLAMGSKEIQAAPEEEEKEPTAWAMKVGASSARRPSSKTNDLKAPLLSKNGDDDANSFAAMVSEDPYDSYQAPEHVIPI